MTAWSKGQAVEMGGQPFILTEFLGQGETAIVWKATNSQGREVAVKFLRLPNYEPLFRTEVKVLRWWRQVELEAGRWHYTPELYAEQLDREPRGMVMELARGQTLPQLREQAQRRGAPVEEVVCVTIGWQFAQVLHHLHTRYSATYSDLKESNIWWDAERKSILVLDWNILHELDRFRLESSGPLVARDLELLNRMIYSLAVGRSLDAYGAPTLDTLWETAGEAWGRLSWGLQQVLRRALSPSAQDRYASAEALAQAYGELARIWESLLIDLEEEQQRAEERQELDSLARLLSIGVKREGAWASVARLEQVTKALEGQTDLGAVRTQFLARSGEARALVEGLLSRGAFVLAALRWKHLLNGAPWEHAPSEKRNEMLTLLDSLERDPQMGLALLQRNPAWELTALAEDIAFQTAMSGGREAADTADVGRALEGFQKAIGILARLTLLDQRYADELARRYGNPAALRAEQEALQAGGIWRQNLAQARDSANGEEARRLLLQALDRGLPAAEVVAAARGALARLQQPPVTAASSSLTGRVAVGEHLTAPPRDAVAEALQVAELALQDRRLGALLGDWRALQALQDADRALEGDSPLKETAEAVGRAWGALADSSLSQGLPIILEERLRRLERLANGAIEAGRFDADVCALAKGWGSAGQDLATRLEQTAERARGRREREQEQRIAREQEARRRELESERQRRQTLLDTWAARAQADTAEEDVGLLRARISAFEEAFTAEERAEPELATIERRLRDSVARAEAHREMRLTLAQYVQRAKTATLFDVLDGVLQEMEAWIASLPTSQAAEAEAQRKVLAQKRDEARERRRLRERLPALRADLSRWRYSIASDPQGRRWAQDALQDMERLLALSPDDAEAVRLRDELRGLLDPPRLSVGGDASEFEPGGVPRRRWALMALQVAGYVLVAALSVVAVRVWPFAAPRPTRATATPVPLALATSTPLTPTTTPTASPTMAASTATPLPVVDLPTPDAAMMQYAQAQATAAAWQGELARQAEQGRVCVPLRWLGVQDIADYAWLAVTPRPVEDILAAGAFEAQWEGEALAVPLWRVAAGACPELAPPPPAADLAVDERAAERLPAEALRWAVYDSAGLLAGAASPAELIVEGGRLLRVSGSPWYKIELGGQTRFVQLLPPPPPPAPTETAAPTPTPAPTETAAPTPTLDPRVELLRAALDAGWACLRGAALGLEGLLPGDGVAAVRVAADAESRRAGESQRQAPVLWKGAIKWISLSDLMGGQACAPQPPGVTQQSSSVTMAADDFPAQATDWPLFDDQGYLIGSRSVAELLSLPSRSVADDGGSVIGLERYEGTGWYSYKDKGDSPRIYFYDRSALGR